MAAESDQDDDEQEIAALARRLKLVVERSGGNKKVAERAGVPLRTLNSYLAGEADPKTTKLGRIAEACATSIDELLGRKLPDAGAENGIILVGATPSADPEFIPIPRLEVRASAGRGLMADPGGDTETSIAFRRAWLRSLGISPGNAEFLPARGDSMEPTIKDGDMMLVDRGYGEVMDGKIYILVVSGLVLVKRVQRLALGGLMLISDNERYPTETIAASDVGDLSIEARVAWYGRAI